MTIAEWCQRVIHGVGGFEDKENHELVVYDTSREQAIAAFVLRALANRHCEGSDEVLRLIIEHRGE